MSDVKGTKRLRADLALPGSSRHAPLRGAAGSGFVGCPACGRQVPAPLINSHLDAECPAAGHAAAAADTAAAAAGRATAACGQDSPMIAARATITGTYRQHAECERAERRSACTAVLFSSVTEQADAAHRGTLCAARVHDVDWGSGVHVVGPLLDGGEAGEALPAVGEGAKEGEAREGRTNNNCALDVKASVGAVADGDAEGGTDDVDVVVVCEVRAPRSEQQDGAVAPWGSSCTDGGAFDTLQAPAACPGQEQVQQSQGAAAATAFGTAAEARASTSAAAAAYASPHEAAGAAVIVGVDGGQSESGTGIPPSLLPVAFLTAQLDAPSRPTVSSLAPAALLLPAVSQPAGTVACLKPPLSQSLSVPLPDRAGTCTDVLMARAAARDVPEGGELADGGVAGTAGEQEPAQPHSQRRQPPHQPQQGEGPGGAAGPGAEPWWRRGRGRGKAAGQPQPHPPQQPQEPREPGEAQGPAPDLFDPGVGLGPLPTVAHPALPGQMLVPGFLAPAEEAALLGLCDGAAAAPPWHSVGGMGTSPHTRAKRWGVRPDYHRRGVANPAHPLPPPLAALAARMRARVPGLQSFHPNEANAIDYRRGSGAQLLPHVDDRILSGDVIVTLSLAGRAVMTFARDKEKGGTKAGPKGGGNGGGAGSEVRVLLPPRSLQVLTRAARYSFTHAIAAADLLDPRRVSITLRFSPLRPYERG